jgi:hypothetical protein
VYYGGGEEENDVITFNTLLYITRGHIILRADRVFWESFKCATQITAQISWKITACSSNIVTVKHAIFALWILVFLSAGFVTNSIDDICGATALRAWCEWINFFLSPFTRVLESGWGFIISWLMQFNRKMKTIYI